MEKSVGELKDSSEKIRAVVQEARDHPFEFGFRYPIQTGKASIVQGESGLWQLSYPASRVEDPVWYGNCTDDFHVTSSFLRNKLEDAGVVTVQYLEARKLGNAFGGTDHFKVRVERHLGAHSVFEEVDHSSFYDQFMGADNATVLEWRDLDRGEENDHYPKDLSRVIRVADGLAYCEFETEGNKGVSLLSIYNLMEGDQHPFVIAFNLMIPGLPKDEAGRALSFPVYKAQLKDRKKLLEALKTNPIEENSLSSDGKELVSSKLQSEVRVWFAEVVSAIASPKLSGPAIFLRWLRKSGD